MQGLTALATNVCFILVYQSMPLADAVAIDYAKFNLRDPAVDSAAVGACRCASLVVGFLGVLLVARPGADALP